MNGNLETYKMSTNNILDGDSFMSKNQSDDVCTSEEALIEHVFANINQMKRSNGFNQLFN